MKLSAQEKKLYDLIAPAVTDCGYDLLWLEFEGETLALFCEDPETGRITLDECRTISRAVSTVLEEKDPIESAYRLEVSSPGIDRPLIRESDYERFKELEVKIELEEPVDPESNQRRYRGVVEGIDNGLITLRTDDKGTLTLPYDNIVKAKLVMNDALIDATRPIADNDNTQPTDEETSKG